MLDVIKSLCDAIMGTNEPAPPAGSRTRRESFSTVRPEGHRSRGTDESSSRVRLESKHIKSSSTGVQGRIAEFETASTDKTQKHAQHLQEASESMHGSENMVTEFQSALTACQKELEEERAEHGKLQRTYSKLRATNKTQDASLAQRNSDNELFKIILKDYLSPYAQTQGIRPDKWTRESLLAVLGALSKDAADANSSATEAISYAAEVRSLNEQVKMLQQEMLANVEKVHIVSDEQFAQDFRVIAALVKSLSRTIRIGNTVDIIEVLHSGRLLKNVSLNHWSNRARKKLLIEAWIWSALIRKVFFTPFMIFGNQCEILNANWISIYQDDHCDRWPIPTFLCELWRCTTMESVLELVDRDVVIHGKEKDVAGKLDSGIIGARNSVFYTIGHRLTRLSTTAVNPSEVRNIVDKAFAFAMHMSLQRVRFQITYPEVGDKFDADRMKYMPELDGEDVDNGIVAFIVNPGLTKWGDAHGKNLDHRYDIVPSLVHLEVVQQETVEPAQGPKGYADVVKRGSQGASTSKVDRSNGGESER